MKRCITNGNKSIQRVHSSSLSGFMIWRVSMVIQVTPKM